MNLHAISFTGCVALLLAHELDAVYRKEWRLLPVLRGMRDEVAVFAFILIHVPLIVALIVAAHLPTSLFASYARATFCGFSVIHVVLHALWPRSDAYAFDNAFSRTLIYGAGCLGALYFALP